MGQGLEASSKIDEMKKQISLVSDLLAGTILDSQNSTDDPNSQSLINGVTPSAGLHGHRHSMSLPMLGQPSAMPPGIIPDFPSANALTAIGQENVLGGDTGAANHGSPDSDSSRKRCASSMGGTRINKAIRLETADGGLPPLTQPATPSAAGTSLGLPLGSVSGLSTSQSTSVLPTPSAPQTTGSQLVLPPTTMGSTLAPLTLGKSSSRSPPSVPHSRSQSPPPGGLGAPGTANWPMLQKQLTASAPVTSALGVLPHVQSSFPVVLPTTAPISAPDPNAAQSAALTNVTPTAGSWTDVKPPTSLTTSLTATGMITAPQASMMAPITYDPPSYPPPGHASMAMAPGASVATGLSSSLGRDSRSSSFSSQMPRPIPPMPAYGAPVDMMAGIESKPTAGINKQPSPAEPVPNSEDRARRLSRAAPSTQRRSPSSSSEEDGESDYEGPYGRERGYSFSKSSPPLKSRDSSRERPSQRQRQSISSPNENAGGAHGNEIPQEYRAEVDRIFFDFLTKICSNREVYSCFFLVITKFALQLRRRMRRVNLFIKR